MTKEQMRERLTKTQQDRQTLAVNIDRAVVRLHHMDGQIQLLTELIATETPAIPVPDVTANSDDDSKQDGQPVRPAPRLL